MAQHTSHKSSVPCQYHLIPGCRTIFSLRWHVNVTANYGTTNKLFYPSCQCHPIIILPIPHSPSEKAEICQHSKCASVSIYVVPCKHHTKSPFDKKEHQHYKYSLLPLVLAVNHIIYLFLNTTFNQADDVNHLIKRLLLILQKYITRRCDFKCFWLELLLSSLSNSHSISLKTLTIIYSRICIVARRSIWFKKIICTMNFTVDKRVMLSSFFAFIVFME